MGNLFFVSDKNHRTSLLLGYFYAHTRCISPRQSISRHSLFHKIWSLALVAGFIYAYTVAYQCEDRWLFLPEKKK